ncbi:hypothetical protein AHF37_09387 [Paragonimus kellicotti]|nr:hypothetical protein AHF37_09387 [Paragonimus kellicotti]
MLNYTLNQCVNWSPYLTHTDVTIANFGSSCPDAEDTVWRTATINEDGFQPTYMEQITLQDVTQESKFYFDRPVLGFVKFGKCGDMECDGLKKALLVDMDGTFLGAPGSIIPQSEWQWDLNPAYGIVTSKVPVRMRTNRDGSTRDVDTTWPKKGEFLELKKMIVTFLGQSWQ